MARLPILMIVLGFGSLILKQFNYHFTLLAWADDYQPAAGAIIGLIGAVILLLITARARAGKPSAGPASAASPAGYGPPAVPPGQPMPPGPNGPAGTNAPGGPAGPAH